MYITRPVSHFRSHPESLSLPPEGPNSGYLVIQDIEPEEIVSCFGLSKDKGDIHLPFPQNIKLTTAYYTGEDTFYDNLAFFPVLNQPLSRNLYYVIESHKKRKGKAYACSKEEDVTTCCFCSQVHDVEPRTLDPDDIYQQFEIVDDHHEGSFYAKSVAHNGIPPYLLRKEGWTVQYETSKEYVIGKWYCPFMFIKDGMWTPSDQMTNSIIYEMILEQRWEQIFERDNVDHGNVVMVDAVVLREVVSVGGREAVWYEKNAVDYKTIWFASLGREEVSVGLRIEIFERMKWEEERVGWVGNEERVVRVNRVVEFAGGAQGWRKLRCYVLVERFVLKRMDGSLVMTYDFKHTHQLNCMWD
ncbi:hypothetical protein DCAR_0727203 [Daucus carota subsp. sativus]|uniref:Uncharacterized protein n=1 Tax=Daucus carota subsp. sativus TaxID=79200 RepID=A0AAF0XIQ7_DAUCS|nr:hypothetical protein DCAR_0727203 [Daucus carota subsp. sativus]